MMEFERMPIPTCEDGEPNFKALATLILEYAKRAKIRRPIPMCFDYQGHLDLFNAREDGRGGIEVERLCLENRFSASLYMALVEQSPERVTVVEE